MEAAARTGRWLPGVDLLRGVACISVYLCHLNSYWHTGESIPWPLPELFEVGAHGVDLFMVISGFCLTIPLVQPTTLKPIAIRRFAIRRATRILPPYWAALAIAAVFAMSPRWYHHVVAQQASVSNLVAHILTLQLIIPNTVSTINGSLWSVALETHLYVVFPLLIWLLTRYGARVLLGGLVAMSILWELIAAAEPVAGLPYNMQLPARLVQFGLGIGCALLVERGLQPPRRVTATVFAVCGLLALAMSTYRITIGEQTMWGVALAALVILLAEADPRGVFRLIAKFGLVSYSFYLLHQPALLVSSSVARHITHNPYVLIAIASTVVFGATWAVSYVFYRLVERPSHHFGRRLSMRVT